MNKNEHKNLFRESRNKKTKEERQKDRYQTRLDVRMKRKHKQFDNAHQQAEAALGKFFSPIYLSFIKKHLNFMNKIFIILFKYLLKK